MGGDVRVRYEAALCVAECLLHYLRPVCERIEIAGSLRRKKDKIGDVELVAVPKTKRDVDMFGEAIGPEKLLIDDALALYRTHEGPLDVLVSGERYWKMIDTAFTIAGTNDFDEPVFLERKDKEGKTLPRGLQIDLFLVRFPAQWGPLYAIRTGPADYSKRMMIALKARGYRCEDGRVLDRKNKVIDCPEEKDFFATMGARWTEPEDRK